VSRRPIVKIIAAVLGGIAVAVSLLGLLVVANGSEGLSASAATTAFGWTIPLIAGGLVGLASWLLLNGDEAEDEGRDLLASTCDVCGRQIFEEWRLCPYCGTITERSARAAVGNEQAVVD
jgi:hypothetical protein